MSARAASVQPGEHPDARLHATLRFAVAVTAAFVLCEFMQWTPSFLAPVLTAVLLANLPMRPPLKLGLVLVAAMSMAALYAFVLSSLFRGTPPILFGLVALSLFLSFHAMLTGRPALPFMLVLVCLATIPVMVMVAPSVAGSLPIALVRGIAIALVMIWIVYVPWTRIVPPPPKSAAPPSAATPLARALLSTAVVMPLMLAYMMFGLADVLPVLIATVILVINFDLQGGRSQALAFIVGNFFGGLLAMLLHTVLLTTPSLLFLSLILFLVLLGFGHRISGGGPKAAVAVIACNGMLVIFSSAIASGPGSLSLWMARLFQFALAGAFAVGMMHLLWNTAVRRSARSPTPASR